MALRALCGVESHVLLAAPVVLAAAAPPRLEQGQRGGAAGAKGLDAGLPRLRGASGGVEAV